MAPARLAAERAARESYGRLLASLVARTGDVAAAEDALSEAFAKALATWPLQGVPQAPEGWLLTTARRLAVDAARHDRVAREALPSLARRKETMRVVDEVERMEDLPDERLKMLFLCAHPAIDPAVRTPLMLQTVLGLDAKRIAAAFLVSPAALAQRLVRAKGKIRDSRLSFELPGRETWNARLADVLESVYAGYAAGWDSLDEASEFADLAADMLWLGERLVELMPAEPEALGLFALMLYGESRRAARRTSEGEYVPLSDQDVSQWDAEKIARAEALLREAVEFERPGRFQLEAAVQSAHAARSRTGMTDWPAIVGLHDLLLVVAPSVGAVVSRAAALCEGGEPEEALRSLDELACDQVAAYQPYWATRAHVLSQLDRVREARDAFQRAIGLSDDPAVRRFLTQRAAELAS